MYFLILSGYYRLDVSNTSCFYAENIQHNIFTLTLYFLKSWLFNNNAGKWALNHVYLDTEYRLVERSCSCQSRCSCCSRFLMYLFDPWFHSHQQVFAYFKQNICLLWHDLLILTAFIDQLQGEA